MNAPRPALTRCVEHGRGQVHTPAGLQMNMTAQSVGHNLAGVVDDAIGKHAPAHAHGLGSHDVHKAGLLRHRRNIQQTCVCLGEGVRLDADAANLCR